MSTITKSFPDYPFAHRQHTHKGHCRLIHGHNWTFVVTFKCKTLDENGFVLDFGKMQFIKDFLKENFDHTTVISIEDPEIDEFTRLESRGLLKLTLLSGASCESLAEWVFRAIDEMLDDSTNGRVSVANVTLFEDSKNSASFTE